MSKVDVKVVIGSNYGDEGKGLATHYFSQQAKNKMCLNVLYNGGCQRGHTVDLKNATTHVFHHFGSGTYDNAHTYFDKDFMVNPMVFVDELNILHSEGVNPICFISPGCRVTTPYDMFINQIVESFRKNNRHGSCGHGIWETQQRYVLSDYNLTFNQLTSKTDKALFEYLFNIAHHYLPERLMVYGINEIPKDYNDLINSSTLISHYICDLREMESKVCQIPFRDLNKRYQVVVFEGAQGLALDEDNTENYPHVTASKTTSSVPMQKVKNLDCDVEICYITRSYFTRHGAGRFPTECDKSEINSVIEDKTNIYNDYQQFIRYGKFDKNEFLNRVFGDYNNSKEIISNVKASVFISHLNYTDGDICGDCNIDFLNQWFNTIYMSFSKYAEDITCL